MRILRGAGLVLAFGLSAWAAPACHPVAGERILAGDLAAASAAFSAIPADTPFAFAPPLRATRVYLVGELERIAARYQLTLDHPEDICFERAAQLLRPEQLVAAMRNVPGFAAAQIEIVEFTRSPVPKGELRF